MTTFYGDLYSLMMSLSLRFRAYGFFSSIRTLGFAESQGFPRQPALERIYRQTGASLLYCMLNAWYTRVDEMKDCMVTVWLPRK
jgi:hypothetical protein